MKTILQLCAIVVFAMFSITATAQDRTISGTVTSTEDGLPLPGVNVLIKATALGTVTDIDGKYQLAVPEGGGILVFSFVGYESKEESIDARSVIDVALGVDVTTLTEVVVTAVGIEREKRALGYAVAEVGGEQITQKGEPDVTRAIQGKVAGVNIIGAGGAVGEGTNIVIRGNSSLLGNNQPLYVVDGVPFDNSTYVSGSFTSRTTTSNRAYDLDPNNIASMTVLKGAAASALYGSRASNGVIVITTKSGKKGTKKGLEITANVSYNIEKVANLPEYQTRYTQGNNFKYVDGNYGTWGASFDATEPEWQLPINADLIFSIDPATGKPYVAHPYDRYSNPENSPYLPQFANDSILLNAYNTPADFFNTGGALDYSVSIAGGNDKANVTGGFSRSDNKGIIPYNEGSRTTINVGGNVELDNGFFMSGSMNYIRNELTSPPTAGLSTAASSITQRLLFTPPNVNAAGYPYMDANGDQAWYRPDNDNPYFLAEKAPHTSDVDRWYGFAQLGYEIFDGLTVSYKAGFNGMYQHNFQVLPISTLDALDGEITDTRFLRNEFDGNLMINLTRDLTSDISLTSILGWNLNSRTLDMQSFYGTGIIVRGLYDMDNLTNVIPNGGGLSQRRYQALFADLSFSYKGWAFLNLVGRNDWTSTLPEASRSYFYGGASGSVIITDALNLDSEILSFGKIRAGWARTGSDHSPYLTQLINYRTNSGIGNNVADISFPFSNANFDAINVQNIRFQLGNPDLTPEFTSEFEIGTDLRFWDHKIALDFTYYDRTTTDQIVPIDIAPTSGYTSRVVNIGEVSNKGVEIGLDVTPISLDNSLEWNIYGVFSKNISEVVSLTDGLDEVFVGGYGDGIQVVHAVGQPYGQIKGSVAARSDDGELLVDPLTGKLITVTELEVIADPNPDFIMGLTNTLKFKGITLSALFDLKKGGQMWSGTYNQVYGRGLTPGTIPTTTDYGRRITVVIPGVVGDPNTQTAVLDESGNTIPNGTQLTVNDWFFINTFGSAGPDEFAVFDATTLRLREVTLAYDFPKTLLDKTPFGTARFSISG
ncbi:MAG: SusC/RagA family TonB-linked outer membrane protein, partial [Bacteroidota bacterium]